MENFFSNYPTFYHTTLINKIHQFGLSEFYLILEEIDCPQGIYVLVVDFYLIILYHLCHLLFCSTYTLTCAILYYLSIFLKVNPYKYFGTWLMRNESDTMIMVILLCYSSTYILHSSEIRGLCSLVDEIT